jgi:hypothetical protein
MNPEQIKQYLALGYTPQMVADHMKITVEQLNALLAAPASPGLPPLPSAPAQAGPVMGTGAAALAAKLADSTVGYGNNAEGRRLPPGTHTVEVTSITYKTGLANGDRVIVEWSPLASSNPSTEIGGAYSWPIDPYDKWKYGMADIKGLAAVFNPALRDRWDAAYFDRMIGPEQPVKGFVLSVSTVVKTAEGSGNEYTKHYSIEPATKPVATPAGLPALPGLPGFPTTMPFPGGQ